jgi:AcrR family transcriptional regulator
MTPIPARILRPLALTCPSRPRPTERERQRRAYLLEAAQAVFEAHGRAPITLRAFADATAVSPSTIQRDFADLHHLFALVLTRHLDAILAAIGQIPEGDPDRLARRRASYRRAAANPDATQSRLHILYCRDRFLLPPDQLEPLEQQRRLIGDLVDPQNGEATLALLDCQTLSLPQIEAMLAPSRPAPAPQANAPAPQANAPAPQANAPAPQANAPAPRANAPAPQITTPAPIPAHPTPPPQTRLSPPGHPAPDGPPIPAFAGRPTIPPPPQSQASTPPH